MPELDRPTQTPPVRYRPFPLTARIGDDTSRFRILCCGRRFGKSTMGIAELWRILARARHAGETDPRALVVAPTFGKVETDWRIATTMLGGLITKRDEADMRLELGAEGVMEFRSADAHGGPARSGGYNGALMDEAAYIPNEVWEADVRPALADRLGQALFLSSPHYRNWFYAIYQLGLEHPDYRSWHYSTWEGWQSRWARDPVKLALMEREWQDIQAQTSERTFRKEYLAEFLEEEGQLWSVARCLRGELRPSRSGMRYVAGVDVAHVEDWMVTLVMERETRQVVALFRSRHRDWSLQKAHATAVLRQYPRVRVLIDSTGVGDPIAQDLRSAGLDVEDIVFGSRGAKKEAIVENLSVAMDHAYIGIPQQTETEWLLEELKSYRERKTPSGHVEYGAPDGLHDDGVTALMLACWGLRFDFQRPVTVEEKMPLAPGVMRAQDWLAHTHRVQRWRRQFPTRRPPESPMALSWSLLNGRW